MKFSPTVFLKDAATFFPFLWAVLRGKYKMPWGTFFWALLCVVYVISPVDLLPDVLPVLGITDDGAFILLVLTLLHRDLHAFPTAAAAPHSAAPAGHLAAKTAEITSFSR